MVSSIPSIFDITIHPVSVQSAEEEYYVQSRACHQRPVWHQGCLANDSVIQRCSVGQPKCTQTNIACGPIQCKIAKGTRQEFETLNHEELLRHRFMCSRNFSLTLVFCRMCTTIHQCWWFIQVHQAGHTWSYYQATN